VLLVVSVGVLYKGIRIDDLSFLNMKVTGLYIKLDKKLFVEADNIKISSNVTKSNNSSLFDVDKILDILPPIYTLFDTIAINNIEYAGENAKITYNDDIFYVDSSKLILRTKLEIAQGRKLNLKIEQVLLKDFDIEISGLLYADIKRDEYSFNGLFRAFDVDGKLNFRITNDIAIYSISSNEFKSPKIILDNLRSKIKLNDVVANWIYGYTKAASYQVLSFDGIINLSTLDFYPKRINAQVLAKDMNVTFRKDVPPANVKNARIEIGNNKIVFLLDKAEYESKKVDASVVINNLLEGERNIAIDLYTNAYFDESINKILKSFTGVQLPIKQLGGNISSYVNINVGIKTLAVNASVTGKFILDNASISIANVDMFSPHAVIDLNNTMINITDARLVYDKIFDISANGTLNTSQKHMDANSFVHYTNIETKNNSIVSLGNISTPFTLDITSEGVKFGFKEFEANLTFGNKSIIALNSLRKLYPYSQLMQQYGIKRGRVDFETSDFTNINGNAHIYGLNLPLFANGSKVSSFKGAFGIQNNSLHANSNDKNIRFGLGESIRVALKNLDVLFDTNGSLKAANNDNGSMPIYANILNGNIKIANSNITVLSENLSLHVGQNNSIQANLTYQNGEIELLKDKNYFTVYAADIKSEFVNALVNKEFFSGGVFSTTISGDSENEFSGIITIRNTKMKDFMTINNIIAFLNTIPALATLSDPKYSSTGFPVKSGIIEFSRIGDFIYIPTLFLEGYSSDIMGIGYIDLSSNEIYLDLRISTIKALSSIINIIPFLNFIVLGEDGKIDVHIYVKGTLDDPKVVTNIAQNTLMSPINIIKRVFQLPFYIFR
jgi:hypothetical protein